MNTLAFTLGEHRAQLTLKISTYPNGNLAIKLYEKDHSILIFWETLTTNLTGIRPDHCAFINPHQNCGDQKQDRQSNDQRLSSKEEPFYMQ